MVLPVTNHRRAAVLAAFAGQDSAEALAKVLGVGRDKIYATWKSEYGDDAIKTRGNRLRGKGNLVGANSENPEVKVAAVSAFLTDEPLKVVALRLGVHYTKVKEWWVGEYGEDRVLCRFKELQVRKARETGMSRRGEQRHLEEEEVACGGCGRSFKANRLSLAKRSGLCDTCRERAKTGVAVAAKLNPVLCPVCGVVCDGQRGVAAHFRHQHPGQSHLENAFAQQTEDEDYVVCRVCGFKASSLGSHLRVHRMSAEEYRTAHPMAQLRACKTEEKRRAAIWEAHVRGAYQGEGKTVDCPRCGTEHKVSKFASPRTHDMNCVACKAQILQEVEDARWVGKSEPGDYVTCRECGHQAENLTSHIQNSHPDLVGRYNEVHIDALIVALSSAVRDKTALRGRELSDETRAKMSENAGRWNNGLTKEIHPSVAAAAAKMAGRESWNTGLTKETHPSIQSTSEKLQAYVGDKRPWNNGLRLNLTKADFTPYLDEVGQVDCAAMTVDLGIPWVTLGYYMEEHGLRNTRKHVLAAALARTIRLSREALTPFLMPNGKISIGRAISGLGYSFTTIKNECVRLGFLIYRANVSQELCLSEIAKLLGGAIYQSEWNVPQFTNPKTGRRFRYDGYFESHGLVVEFHGYQHWTFPNCFLKYEELRPEWETMLERDRVKREMIENTPGLIFFCIREDEPFWDPDYLRVQLKDLGIST